MKMALNMRQEKFIQNIIKGMSQRQAYKDVYKSKYSDKAIDEHASTLFNSAKVQERYKELLKELEDKAIMSAKERIIWLSKVVKGDIKHTSYDGNGNSYENEAYISDKMRAIDIMNKMTGEYTTNIKGNVSLSYEQVLKNVSEADEY